MQAMRQDELNEYLNSLAVDESFRTEETLRGSAGETTQIVSFVGGNGSGFGPFIRKTIPLDGRSGLAYPRILAAWKSGRRFKHVPRVFDCFERNGELIVIMEYVPGETLAEFVARRGPSSALAKRLATPLCDAVAELHESFDPPLIHRDIKPSNIIVSGEAVTIIDFGIARSWHEDATEDTTHFGTRPYAPPEQFGFGQTDERSDVYALGMVLYFCITGKTPSTSLHAEGFPDLFAEPTLKSIIVKATEFDPKHRFANARELVGALNEAACATEKPPRLQSPATDDGSTSPRDASKPSASKRSVWSRIRNTALLTIFAFGAFCGISCAVYPTAQYSSIPLVSRLIAFGGVFIVMNGALVYLLLDKRELRRRYPALERFRGKRERIACALLVIAGAFATQLLT